MTTLEFFFDPGCPWTWLTSRWAVEVAARRDVPIRWRAYSLALKNENVETHEAVSADDPHHPGPLRVVEAVWAQHGDEPIGRLYTEMGNRFHLQSDNSHDAVTAAVEAAGLDPALAAAAEEERWDAEIRASMADAIVHVGKEVGVPILVLRDGDRVAGISGPIMSPAPTGDEALVVWDAVSTLVFVPGFYEVKRSRTARPQFASDE